MLENSKLKALGGLFIGSVMQLGTACDRCGFYDNTGLVCTGNMVYAIICGILSTAMVMSMLYLGHHRFELAQKHEPMVSVNCDP